MSRLSRSFEVFPVLNSFAMGGIAPLGKREVAFIVECQVLGLFVHISWVLHGISSF